MNGEISHLFTAIIEGLEYFWLFVIFNLANTTRARTTIASKIKILIL